MSNRIQCLQCGLVLESKHRHDFSQCSCPNAAFVDGGNDYKRVGAIDLDKVKHIKSDSDVVQIEKGEK